MGDPRMDAKSINSWGILKIETYRKVQKKNLIPQGQDDLGLCGRTRKLNFLTHVKIVFWIEKMYVSPNSGGVLVHFKQKKHENQY